jgi:thymidylate synthase (FAD)
MKMTTSKVEYIDHMGSDLSPIRAAIVSNGKTDFSKYVDDDLKYTTAAKSLIGFLARGCTSGEWKNLVGELMGYSADDQNEIISILNEIRNMPTHWTPFGHTAITVHVKAPIFVARQLGKHQVGFVWNEISRRYVDSPPEFYIPDVWRGKAKDKKQGSEGIVNPEYNPQYLDAKLKFAYLQALNMGIAPEQARMLLPQSQFVEWYWTGNLYAFAKMFIARTDSHTQKETQDVAHMIGNTIQPLFPISWKALTQ